MARDDHWFKFYYHRIMVSCAGWKDDEFGAYIKLLIHQFDKGFIPSDETQLKRLISSYKKNWPLIKTKFIEKEPGVLINPVMDDVRMERLEKKEINVINGKKGGRPKNQNETQNKPNGFKNKRHIYSNSNSVSDFEEKGVQGEKDFSDHDAEKTVEYARITLHRDYDLKKVYELWGAFCILNEGKFYESQHEKVKHFRNSLEHIPYEQTSKNGKLGTSEARIEALKKW